MVIDNLLLIMTSLKTRKERTKQFMQTQDELLFDLIIQKQKILEEKLESNNNQNADAPITIENNYDMEFLISEIKFLNLNIIDKLVTNNKEFPNLWKSISCNPEFDITWYEKYPYKPWESKYWCFSTHFKIDWVIKYPDVDWSWVDICYHSSVTFEILVKNINLPWNWSGLATNQRVDIRWLEIFAKQKCKTKIWKKLSYHSNLQLSWIQKYSFFPWDWKYISECQNLRLEWLLAFPHKSWNWSTISDSPHMEYTWYLAFPDADWDFGELMLNPNFYQSYLVYQARRYLAAYKIQKWWVKILYNPNSQPGSRFVSKLYDKN